MKTMFKKTLLPLAALMAVTAFPLSSTAMACEDAQCGHARGVQWEEYTPVSNNAGYVYDESGNIVDYWSDSDRTPFFAYPDCSSHDWELVYKYAQSANGYQVKVYNRRCKKCSRYKYTSWSYSPVS